MPLHSGLQSFYTKFSKWPYRSSLLYDSVLSLVAFRILSLCLTSAILIILYVSVGLFWFTLLHILCTFCLWLFPSSGLESFSHNFIKYILPFSLSFVWDAYNMNADMLNVINRSVKMFSFLLDFLLATLIGDFHYYVFLCIIWSAVYILCFSYQLLYSSALFFFFLFSSCLLEFSWYFFFFFFFSQFS